LSKAVTEFLLLPRARACVVVVVVVVGTITYIVLPVHRKLSSLFLLSLFLFSSLRRRDERIRDAFTLLCTHRQNNRQRTAAAGPCSFLSGARAVSAYYTYARDGAPIDLRPSLIL